MRHDVPVEHTLLQLDLVPLWWEVSEDPEEICFHFSKKEFIVTWKAQYNSITIDNSNSVVRHFTCFPGQYYSLSLKMLDRIKNNSPFTEDSITTQILQKFFTSGWFA